MSRVKNADATFGMPLEQIHRIESEDTETLSLNKRAEANGYSMTFDVVGDDWHCWLSHEEEPEPRLIRAAFREDIERELTNMGVFAR